MRIYIGYWNHKKFTGITIKEIEAEYNPTKNRCKWDHLIIPEIYPQYNMINCGAEERAYFNKSIHYFVSDNMAALEKYLNNMKTRRQNYYKDKLDEWQNEDVMVVTL